MQTVIKLDIPIQDALNVASALTGVYPGVVVAMTGDKLFAYQDWEGPNVFVGLIKPRFPAGCAVEIDSFGPTGESVSRWVVNKFTQ